MPTNETLGECEYDIVEYTVKYECDQTGPNERW